MNDYWAAEEKFGRLWRTLAKAEGHEMRHPSRPRRAEGSDSIERQERRVANQERVKAAAKLGLTQAEASISLRIPMNTIKRWTRTQGIQWKGSWKNEQV